EMVKREAALHGLSVTRAELVGLIPQRALLESARWYLQLDDLQDDQVLELRLQSAAAEEAAEAEATARLKPGPFVDAVAASTPTPGGGSVAALVGALAAAL